MKHKHYPPKIWASIISDYQTGDYTVKDLSAKYGPNEDTINVTLSNKGIRKGELIKEIQASQAERYRKALADRGYDEVGIVGKITQLLEAEQRDPYNPKKKVADLNKIDMGLKHVARFTQSEKTEDKNQTTQVPQIKILIMSKDGEIKTNLGMEGIDI